MDNGSFFILGKHLDWGPDGKMALAKTGTSPPQVIHWPDGAVFSRLPAGKYCWADAGMLCHLTRENISTLDWRGGEWVESGRTPPPPGERWVWVHGLGRGVWAALRWSPLDRAVGLSRWRGGQWPIEHFRLPQVRTLLPTAWDWSADNESWILLAHHDRILTGWTFPQGLEWLRKTSSARSACLSDQGVFWAEGSSVIYLDRESQEVSEWGGQEQITGMAWNQHRRCLALTSRKGIDILLA